MDSSHRSAPVLVKAQDPACGTWAPVEPMAKFDQDSKPVSMTAKMSQETLAEMIGTTRSRVSFFLNRFRELGFINYNGSGMHVHSSLASVVLHD